TGDDANSNYHTVAYAAATGAQRWAAQYAGLGSTVAVAVSPGGGTVFITGFSGFFRGITTIGYRAATGAQWWEAHYKPAGNHFPHAMAVRPDGRTVFVPGSSQPQDAAQLAITLAYNAATGAKLWQKTFKGLSNGMQAGHSVAVSPDGSTVYVTGDGAGTPGR